MDVKEVDVSCLRVDESLFRMSGSKTERTSTDIGHFERREGRRERGGGGRGGGRGRRWKVRVHKDMRKMREGMRRWPKSME